MTQTTHKSPEDHTISHHEGQGPTSFWMQDPEQVFHELALEPGMHFLDLGCGRGDYSLEAARRVGSLGHVTALDISHGTVDHLNKTASHLGIYNLEAAAADITLFIPLKDQSADICLLSTVLHIPVVSRHLGGLYKEVERVLKPKGRFIILECKKESWDFGPPIEMKWSPEEVQNSIRNYGFEKIRFSEFKYNYCIQFILSDINIK